MQFGPVRGVLLRVEPFDVHSQPNWRCVYRLDTDPDVAERIAVFPRESVHAGPQAGQAVVLELVMGEPVSMRLA